MEKLLRFDGMRLPKGMPSDAILKYIISPSPASHFLPSIHSKSGKRQPPKISFGIQKKIRDACLYADIDPTTVGLAVESPLEIYNTLSESDFVPPGRGRELARLNKQLKIQEKMSKMDDKIAEWKAVIFNLFFNLIGKGAS